MSANAYPRPLVSVVIATYNMGRYVAEAIRSVQAQTVTDLEIHVVDDGSTDETRTIVSALLADRRVHYHFQQNAGQTRAKNTGLKHSRGQYIGFCDADDLWLPNKLELQLPAFGTDPEVAVVYTRSQPIDQAGELLPAPAFPEYTGRITEQLFLENFIPFGTALVRADAIERHGGFNERYRMGIDWELWLRLSIHYRFNFVPERTYLYRIWEGQMSSNWRGRYDACFRIMDEFRREYPEFVPRATVRKALAHSYANRARARADISRDYGGAIADCAAAVRHGLSPISAARFLLRCAAQSMNLLSAGRP